MKTEVAKCAVEIRKILKAKNIKASVRSSNFSMGDSVDVDIKEIIDPKVYNSIKEELSKYQYGHFNGMEDIYESSNHIEEIPQTKFLTISYDWKLQDEVLEKINHYLRDKINFDNCANPDFEYKRMSGDLLMGRDDFIKWEEIKTVLEQTKEEA